MEKLNKFLERHFGINTKVLFVLAMVGLAILLGYLLKDYNLLDGFQYID